MERFIEIIMKKLRDSISTGEVDKPTLSRIAVTGEQSSGKSSVPEEASGMERLIEIMNKLQDLSTISGVVLPALPQIVVIGEQSSGKSSVLESLVKQPILPRGEGLVTRCPIVLQLIHTPLESGPAEEWCELLHKPQKYTDFEEAKEEIQAQVNRIAGSNKGIVSDRITVKIFSPRVLTLTVVDLPGLVKVPIGDQPEDIEDQVNNMVKSFIEDEKTIILAVCTAVQDIAASEAIKVAKKYDPEGLRTIVVITKLDMMSPGSSAEDTLRGRTLPVKLGIVGVVNRSPKENQRNKSIELALKDEEAFLKKKYPAIAARNGSRHLAKTLQKILLDHIRRWIPDILEHVSEMISSAKDELAEYGESPKDKMMELLELINDFIGTVDSAIDGKSRHIPRDRLLGGEGINHIFNNILRQQLGTVVTHDIKNEEILTTIMNSAGIEYIGLNVEKAFRDLVKHKILQLEKPVQMCAKLIHAEIQNITRICLEGSGKNLNRFPNLTSAIKLEVNTMLTKFYENAQQCLQEYVSIQACFTFTPNDNFMTKMERMIKKSALSKTFIGANSNSNEQEVSDDQEKDEEEDNDVKLCVNVKALMHEYFKIIRSTFMGYVPKALTYHMVYKFQKEVRTTLMKRLYAEDRIEDLMEELPYIAEDREDAKRRFDVLNEAEKMLIELRDSA